MIPILIDFSNSTDKTILQGEKILKKQGLIKKGDLLVIVAGKTLMKGATNMMKVERVS